MTVVDMSEQRRFRSKRLKLPEGITLWDTDTATAALVVGALAYLVLVRIGFADVVAP